jgi:hypothetical protein
VRLFVSTRKVWGIWMWWRGCGIWLLCVSVRGCVLAGKERAEGNVEVVVEGKERKGSRTYGVGSGL